VVSDGERLLLGSTEGGDEPVMLARRLPGVPVLVGRRRPVTARAATTQFGASVCILDDGFQVWNLKKDLEIVLLDSGRAFDNGFVLPRGMLREPPARLRRAHAVVLVDPDRFRPEGVAELRAVVRRMAPEAVIAEACRVPERLWDLAGGAELPPGALRGLPVVALSAIGNPEGFEGLLRKLGAQVYCQRLPDHHRYAQRDLENAEQIARSAGAAAIVTTEKDAVKLGIGEFGRAGAGQASGGEAITPAATAEGRVPIWVLSIRLQFLAGEDALRELVIGTATGKMGK
jgi:tetraacyldisaccharide 4'-kinase